MYKYRDDRLTFIADRICVRRLPHGKKVARLKRWHVGRVDRVDHLFGPHRMTFIADRISVRRDAAFHRNPPPFIAVLSADFCLERFLCACGHT